MTDSLMEDPIPPASNASPSSLTSTPTVDSAINPDYLHHTDNTGLVFVKNKLGFIDGSLPHPTVELLSAWICNNHVVIAWILNSVSKEISPSILFSECARDIWVDLKERFDKSNGP